MNIAVEEVANVCEEIPTKEERKTTFNPPQKEYGHQVYQPQPLTSPKKTNQADDETPPKTDFKPPELSQPDVKPSATPQPTQQESENLTIHSTFIFSPQ